MTKSGTMVSFSNSKVMASLIVYLLQSKIVVLNGKSSGRSSVTAGVPKGSVLGPLFFLVYINDLMDNISSETK